MRPKYRIEILVASEENLGKVLALTADINSGKEVNAQINFEKIVSVPHTKNAVKRGDITAAIIEHLRSAPARTSSPSEFFKINPDTFPKTSVWSAFTRLKKLKKVSSKGGKYTLMKEAK